MANKHRKSSLTSLDIRKMQNKTMRCQFPPAEMSTKKLASVYISKN